MSDPLAGFLEGLAGGFSGGYGLRTDRDERRRRRVLEDEELAYRRGERARQAFERERDDAERAQRTGVAFTNPMAEAPDVGGAFDADRQFGAGARVGELRQQVGEQLYQGLPEIRTQPFGAAFRQVGRSEADDESIQRAELGSRVGEALVRAHGVDSQFSPSDRTLLGTGDLPATAVTAAGDRAERARAASYYRSQYRDLGSVPDEEAVRLGRYRYQQQFDTRPAGGGAPAPTGPSASTVADRVRRMAASIMDQADLRGGMTWADALDQAIERFGGEVTPEVLRLLQRQASAPPAATQPDSRVDYLPGGRRFRY